MQKIPKGVSKGIRPFGRGVHGQLTLAGILYTFISIVVFVALLPVLTTIVDMGVNSTNTTTNGDITSSLLNLIIPVMAIGILFSFIAYVVPSRREQ